MASVAAIASLMTQLASAGLQDQVTLMSLNVFGRTIGPGMVETVQSNSGGAPAQPQPRVSFAVKPSRGRHRRNRSVGGRLQALAIDSKTGNGSASGDVRR